MSALRCAWKAVRHDPWHKTYPSRVYNGAVAWLFGLPLHDVNCGFKAMKTQVAKSIRVAKEQELARPDELEELPLFGVGVLRLIAGDKPPPSHDQPPKPLAPFKEPDRALDKVFVAQAIAVMSEELGPGRGLHRWKGSPVARVTTERTK